MSCTVSDDLLKKHPGYGILTAQIFYHFPDFPLIVSPRWLIRQLHDGYPDLPRLNEYLAWWEQKIEGHISFVRYSHVLLVAKSEVRVVKGVYNYKVQRH